MGFSGSSGGGASSGEVDYPEYQKTIHADWLGGGAWDTPSGLTDLDTGNDITSLLNDMIGASPYTGEVAYSPDTEIASQKTSITTYGTAADTAITEFETYLDALDTTTAVDNLLSRFKGGMRNINAVQSSAFLIGSSIVASGLVELKLKGHESIMKTKLDKAYRVNILTLEVSKLSVIALKEELDKNLKIAVQDATWDIDTFQSGANVFASIAGGTVSKSADGPSELQSAVGGAFSGAAAGSAMTDGNWWGIAAGAVIGAGSTYL